MDERAAVHCFMWSNVTEPLLWLHEPEVMGLNTDPFEKSVMQTLLIRLTRLKLRSDESRWCNSVYDQNPCKRHIGLLLYVYNATCSYLSQKTNITVQSITGVTHRLNGIIFLVHLHPHISYNLTSQLEGIGSDGPKSAHVNTATVQYLKVMSWN